MIKRSELVLFVFLFASIYSRAQSVEIIEIRPGIEDGFDTEVRTDRYYPIWYEDDFISNAWTVGGEVFTQRSLIRFDLAAIPQKSEIVSARLSLFCNTESGHSQLHSGENASVLKRIISPWDQYNVIWNNQPDVTNTGAVFLPKSISQNEDYLNIDVTEHIQYFKRNPELNYGFMFQLLDEYPYRALVFASSNHLNPMKRPLLVIEYVPCKVPDTSFSYHMSEVSNNVQFTLDEDPECEYWWNFGNGYFSDNSNPQFTFPESGDYNVCLTVSNDCDTLTNCKNVRVCNFDSLRFETVLNDYMVEFGFSQSGIIIYEYLWNFGDGFLSYLSNPVHIYSEPGNYEVCVMLNTSCGEFYYCDSVLLRNLGFSNKMVENELLVYPNPSSGQISIKLSENSEVLTSVSLVDMKGLTHFFQSFNPSASGISRFDHDFTSMDKGVYYLLVGTKKRAFVKKIVLL